MPVSIQKPSQSLTELTRTTDDRDYARERSRSPGPDRDGDARIRDEPNGRGGGRYVGSLGLRQATCVKTC